MSNKSSVLGTFLALTTVTTVLLASNFKARRYGQQINQRILTPDLLYSYANKVMDLLDKKSTDKPIVEVEAEKVEIVS